MGVVKLLRDKVRTYTFKQKCPPIFVGLEAAVLQLRLETQITHHVWLFALPRLGLKQELEVASKLGIA